MRKTAVRTHLLIVMILVSVSLLIGCQDVSLDPGTISGTLVNVDGAIPASRFLASVFNTGDDINTATPLGNIVQTIVGGTASGVAVDGDDNPILFSGGAYQVSVLVDLDGSDGVSSGDKVTIVIVTVDGNGVFTLDFTGSGWLTIP